MRSWRPAGFALISSSGSEHFGPRFFGDPFPFGDTLPFGDPFGDDLAFGDTLPFGELTFGETVMADFVTFVYVVECSFISKFIWG